MAFTTPLQWTNAGTAPSTSLKQNGFAGGYRPAAQTFNYYLHNQQVCLEELQDFLSTPKSVGKSVAGETMSPTQGNTAVAKAGAEIFNDYRPRIYDETGISSTGNVATGQYSHAEGLLTTATGDFSHAEGNKTQAIGIASHSEGYKSIVKGNYSHAEGSQTEASGEGSHAEGQGTKATGLYSHAEGYGTLASGSASHAEGQQTTASGKCAHAEGYYTQATGDYSHAGGSHTHAWGNFSYAKGQGTQANAYQAVLGIFNSPVAGPTSLTDTSGSVFIVGSGTGTTTDFSTATSSSNAFRISKAGVCYARQTWGSTGADYAEYFEWLDGNLEDEDRRGLFVTLDNGKIRIANADDEYILGVISSKPAILGNNPDDNWQGMYLKDAFGSLITETVEVEGGTETRHVLNPEFNCTREYVSRENRPEWDAVGTHGQLVMVDDGTCQVNGYCTTAVGGIATATADKTPYRVIRRLDDNHIKIYINSR